MTAPAPRLRLTPFVQEIATGLFEAMERVVDHDQDAARPGYFQTVWTIFIGPRAYARFCAEAGPPGHDYVVGRTFIERDGTEVRHRVQGPIDAFTILGVRLVEDPHGPLDLWRVCNPDGSTVCYGGAA